MPLSVPETAMMTLPALREQYRLHGLTIHSVCAERVRKRLLCVDRLFAYMGPLKNAGELADCLNEATLTRYLLDYARKKEELLHEKAGIRERIRRIEKQGSAWLVMLRAT